MSDCPKCQTAVGPDDQECPHCGIFFSKWHEREENIAAGNLSRYASLAQATSPHFNWTMLIIVSLAVIAALYYFNHQALLNS